MLWQVLMGVLRIGNALCWANHSLKGLCRHFRAVFEGRCPSLRDSALSGLGLQGLNDNVVLLSGQKGTAYWMDISTQEKSDDGPPSGRAFISITASAASIQRKCIIAVEICMLSNFPRWRGHAYKSPPWRAFVSAGVGVPNTDPMLQGKHPPEPYPASMFSSPTHLRPTRLP